MTRFIQIATFVAFCPCTSWSQATAAPQPNVILIRANGH